MIRQARAWVEAYGPPILVVTVGVALAGRTRTLWGDPVSDFGREIYLAWRLSEGSVLYRDVAHFNGPLASYVNAGWLAVTGPGLAQLIALNLLVLAVVTTALFSICRAAGDRVVATVAALVFLGLQGFGYFGGGTFNFVTPYSHDLTWGLLLGLLAVVVSGAYARTGRNGWALAGGLCVGLSLLTKPEAFLGTALATAVGLWAGSRYRAARVAGRTLRSSRRIPGVALAAVAGTVTPPLVAFAGLSAAADASIAWDGLTRQWRMVMDSRIRGLAYYDWVRGLDAVGSNLVAIAVWTLGAVVAVLVLARTSRAMRPLPFGGVLPFAGVAVAVLAAGQWAPWHRVWFVLPVAVAAILLDSGSRVLRRAGRPGREVTTLALAMLAAALLSKQALYPRITHYGFALAAPAVALTVIGLLARIPARMEKGAGVFRACALGLITAIALYHFGLSQAAVAATASGVRVGTEREALRADSLRGLVLREVIDHLQARPEREGASLAVLPEGAYLNFVLRRPNGTGFVHLMPPELITWGEEAVLEAYRRSPPDVVVLLHRDWSEYGTGPFGITYGRDLMRWLRSGYRSVRIVGDPPFRAESEFGAEILDRKAPPAADRTPRSATDSGREVEGSAAPASHDR